MSSETQPVPGDSGAGSAAGTPGALATPRRRIGPVLMLLLLSPIIAELLSGSLRLTTIFALIPCIGVWGCAALLIREVARRRGGSYGTMLLLGLALAIAEECIIQQTSLAPLVGMDPAHIYSRAFGVNWEYFLWALGFESIWAVVLPIALAEILCPERRLQPWLGRTGITLSVVAMALSSFVAWYSWTQVMLPKLYPDSVYHVPLYATVAALVAMAFLIAMALLRWPAARSTAKPAPNPWLVGPCVSALALVWFLQVAAAFNALPSIPPAAALTVGCAIAAFAWWLLRRWSSSDCWHGGHVLAAVFGVLIATMVGGCITVALSGALLVDRIAHIVFNLIALALLLRWSMMSRVATAQPDLRIAFTAATTTLSGHVHRNR